MKWTKFTIETTPWAEDLVADLCNELGVEGVEIEDNIPLSEEDVKKQFIDIVPRLTDDPTVAYVSFYLDADQDYSEILYRLYNGLTELRDFVDVGRGGVSHTETEDVDWLNNWKAYFKPFFVDDILIKPTWEELDSQENYHILVEIDPGTAFGTGSHETTQLCIRGIRKYLKEDDHVLDVGCGSGILGIVAYKLGAKQCFGTDIDQIAVDIAEENRELNQVPAEAFPIICGDIISDEKVQEQAGMECYDLVVANILADVIIPLQKEITKHMKHGAYFISSGIIDMKEDAVRAALEGNPELEIVETLYQGEWVSFVARRK